MTTTGTDRAPAPSRGARSDDGLSLVEVVVAMAVLSIMSVAVLRLLLGGMDTSEDSRQRVAASQLAAREIEVARNEFFRDTPSMLALASSGTVMNATPLAGGGTTLDGTAYTVRRSVQWVPTGNGASACDGGSLVGHPSLRVSIDVTWADMGSTRPVVNETLLTPPKSSVPTAAAGYLAVRARNAAGQGQPGVSAVISRGTTTLSQTTDESGCAIFSVSTAGSWQVALDTPGYVDQTGAARPTTTAAVTLGQLAVASLTYDRPASVAVTLAARPGYAMPARFSPDASPSALPAVVYERPNVDAALKRTVVPNAGTTTTVAGLWPTTNGYAFWAGSCADSDPAAPPTSGSRSPSVAVSPGATSAATVTLAPLDVTVTIAGVPQVGRDVYAFHEGCSTQDDEWLYLGRTGSGGALKGSVPYGQWRIGTSAPYERVTTSGSGATVVVVDGVA